MKITTKIGRGTAVHAARYEPTTGTIDLFCDTLKYPNYYAAINNTATPDESNVTCKKCLIKIKGETK